MAALSFFLYIFQVSVALSLLWIIYLFQAKGTTFYFLNRLTIITIICLSVLIPVLPISFLPATINNSIFLGHVLKPSFNNGKVIAAQSSAHFNAISWLPIVIYSAGVIFVLLRLLLQITKIIKLITGIKKEKCEGYNLITTNQPVPPFSFFKWIIINPDNCSQQAIQHILIHEQVHVKQWHILDILFMEIFTAFFWFHPLSWQMKNQLKINLEYLADRDTLNSGAIPIYTFEVYITRRKNSGCCLLQSITTKTKDYHDENKTVF